MARNPLIRKKEKSYATPMKNQSAGILDDFAVRKVVATKEGSITRTPVDDIDIANKAYVDSNDFWKRVGDVLSPKTAGDDLNMGIGFVGVGCDPTYGGDIVSNTGFGQLRLGSSSADSTPKVFGLVGRHYDADEPDIALLFGQSLSAQTDLFWGGGGAFNPATSQNFITSFDNDAGGGSVRYTISDAGNHDFKAGDIKTTGSVIIGTSTAPVSKFHVQTDAWNAGSNIHLASIINRDGNSVDSAGLLVKGGANSATGRTFEVQDYSGNTDFIMYGDGHSEFSGDIETVGVYSQSKIKLTPLGGYAIKLTNKTGSNSVAGELVNASSATENAVEQTAINDEIPIGAFLDSGVSDGSEAWIVVSGIAQVLLDDTIAASVGDWMKVSSNDAGRAESSGSEAPEINHFREIGHCLENGNAGELVKIAMHFN